MTVDTFTVILTILKRPFKQRESNSTMGFDSVMALDGVVLSTELSQLYQNPCFDSATTFAKPELRTL